MELPIKKPSLWLSHLSNQLFKPLLQPVPLMDEDIIMMPIKEIEVALRQAYVKQSPLKLLIEYYPQASSYLQMSEVEAIILSPLLLSGHVKVQIANEVTFLHVNQMINVTAITETLIA